MPHLKTGLSVSSILGIGTDVLGVCSKTLDKERYAHDDYSNGINVGVIYYFDYNEHVTIK